MKVGVLIGGETTVRAAHALSADPAVDELVVLGPAKSHNFRVAKSAKGLDVLVGAGPDAPAQARRHSLPLVWDGNQPDDAAMVWGASLVGVATSIAKRQTSATLIAVAHPESPQGSGKSVRFARPVGATQVTETSVDSVMVGVGRSYNEYAACLVATRKRLITIVDHAAFLSGIALAAGVGVIGRESRPVWSSALLYLEMASGMGLVIADAPAPA